MDITISPHNLKRFAASITCLGKIGKDLYLSFDPLDGLTLSSLNEAKSAFGKFHFEPAFFEKCGGGALTTTAVAGRGGEMWRNNNRTVNENNASRGNLSNDNTNNRHRTNDDDDESDNNDNDNYDSRYICRVPVRSVHSILRPRKGVMSLRIRSEGMDGDGHYFGLNRMKQGNDHDANINRGRDCHRHRGWGGSSSRSRDADEDERQGREHCSFSSRERSRSRLRRKQNKTNQHEDDDDNNDDNADGISYNTKKMMLSFEYHIECLTSKNDMTSNHPNHHHTHNKSTTTHGIAGGTFRVLHKVGVTDCNGISLSESVAQRRSRSEIISHPRLWLRLIDPLRRTPEMALTIDDELKVVTATSFHPMEVQSGGSSGINNAILQAAVARNAVLKTETSMGADEFDEFDFRNNRGKKMNTRGNTRDEHAADSEEDESADIAGNDETCDDNEVNERDRPPLDVNQKVILVFSIKEAKAILQYAAQAYSQSSYNDHDDGIGGRVIVSFHWGGRPIIIETEGDDFTAELVLATLHHGMIASNITVSGGGG